MDFPQFFNVFIGLLVIANPLSALPAVLKITRYQSLQEKKRTGLTSAFAVGIILVVVTWIGTPLLIVFGIKLPAFQVAGGIVIFALSLSLLNAEDSFIRGTPEELTEKRTNLGAIVPLAIPIIAGPGAISSIIVNVNEFPGPLNQLIISFAAILVAFVMGLLLYFAASLEKFFGQLGLNIINRLGGLILAAISVQTIANGIIGLFPFLGTHPGGY